MLKEFKKCPSCGYFYNEKNTDKCYSCGNGFLVKYELIDIKLQTVCCPNCKNYIETYRGDIAQCMCGNIFQITQETIVPNIKVAFDKEKIEYLMREDNVFSENMSFEDKGRSR